MAANNDDDDVQDDRDAITPPGFYGRPTEFESARLVPEHVADAERDHQELLSTSRRTAIVRAAYDAGTPFFTLEAIRRFVQEADAHAAGDPAVRCFRFAGVGGVGAEFLAETGTLAMGGAFRRSRVLLDYHTADQLMRMSPLLGARRSFLPLSPLYLLEEWDAMTGRPVPDPIGRMPADRLRREFEAAVGAWEASEHGQRVRRQLAALIPTLPCRIGSVVEFAGGTLASGPETENLSQPSLLQHALVRLLREAWGTEQVECFAQDPAYTAEDECVLGAAGIGVLQDPCGFLRLDAASAVVGIAPNIPLRQIVADIARPAVLIWNTYRDYADMGFYSTDPVSSRVKAMMENEYTVTEFPSSPEFKDVSIWIRRPGVAQGEHDEN